MRAALVIIAALAFAVPAALACEQPPAGTCLTATGAYVFCPAAPVADVQAPPDTFLCYSKSQVDPGAWPAAEAPALLSAGYWLPFAVTTPTQTYLGHGVYLACNGYQATGETAGADGTNLGAVGWTAGMPDYYPVGV